MFSVSWLLLDRSPGVACVADSAGGTRYHPPALFNTPLCLGTPCPHPSTQAWLAAAVQWTMVEEGCEGRVLKKVMGSQ